MSAAIASGVTKATLFLLLLQALKHMQRDKTDRGSALRELAMHEHDRIIDAALQVRHIPCRNFRHEIVLEASRAARRCQHLLCIPLEFDELL